VIFTSFARSSIKAHTAGLMTFMFSPERDLRCELHHNLVPVEKEAQANCRGEIVGLEDLSVAPRAAVAKI
jgi:hypothetical protein